MINRKKILFISHSNEFNGSEKYLWDIVSLLNKDYFDCLVLVPKKGGILYDKLRNIKSVKVVQTQYYWSVYKPDLLSLLKSIPQGIISVLNIFRVIYLEKPDIVFTNTIVCIYGVIVAKMLKIKNILNVHESLYSLKVGVISGQKFYEKVLVLCCDYIIFNSMWTRTVYPILTRAKNRIIYNGFDFTSCNIKDIEKALSKESVVTIAVIGGVCPNKGQLSALKIVHQLQRNGFRVKLHMYGEIVEKSYYEELKQTIEENSLCDIAVINKYSEDVRLIYTECDILLVPSIVESFSRVVVEGMWFRKYVVARKTGGIPEIIKDGVNGFLFSSESEAVEKIIHLIDDQEMQRKVVRNTKSIYEQFPLRRTVQEIETTLKELV